MSDPQHDRKMKLDDKERARIARLYVEHELSLSQLASRFHRSKDTIASILRNAGIVVRDRSAASRLSRYREDA